MKSRFCARNHLCYLPKYKDSGKTWGQVFESDPEYVLWVFENLKHLRFGTSFSKRIKKYRNQSKNIGR